MLTRILILVLAGSPL